ncbi:MAG: hypothetical protein V4619_00540 [Bacteroidota bacterium]
MKASQQPGFLHTIQEYFIKDHRYSYITLVVLCLFAYFPTFNNQFQNFWDDQWVVINTYTTDGFALANVKRILSEYYHGQYAPVNQLFYTLLFKLFGYNPFWFHAACLGIHVLNASLIFSFIKRLLLLSNEFAESSIWRLAFFTSLLFAIHPFLVEAVAWVSASKILLYALFYLIALHYYLRYTISLKLRYYLLALFFYIVSFGAKEQAVTFPVFVILIDYVSKRNLKDPQVWLEKLPIIVLTISFGIFTMLSQAATGSGALSTEASYPFGQRVIFASYALFEYLFKCIIPYKLSYLYPFPNVVGQAVPPRFWPYPVALVVIIICLWSFLKQKWVAFGLLFFLIHIAVALHIIPISRFAIVADRYVYLASAGVFFVMALLLDKAVALLPKYKILFTTLIVIYVCALALYTNSYVKHWHDTDTLKKEVTELLKQRPDYKAQ